TGGGHVARGRDRPAGAVMLAGAGGEPGPSRERRRRDRNDTYEPHGPKVTTMAPPRGAFPAKWPWAAASPVHEPPPAQMCPGPGWLQMCARARPAQLGGAWAVACLAQIAAEPFDYLGRVLGGDPDHRPHCVRQRDPR